MSLGGGVPYSCTFSLYLLNSDLLDRIALENCLKGWPLANSLKGRAMRKVLKGTDFRKLLH